VAALVELGPRLRSVVSSGQLCRSVSVLYRICYRNIPLELIVVGKWRSGLVVDTGGVEFTSYALDPSCGHCFRIPDCSISFLPWSTSY
jgi:hypothetical protein